LAILHVIRYEFEATLQTLSVMDQSLIK